MPDAANRVGIIGKGRFGSAFYHSLDQIGVPVTCWTRSDPEGGFTAWLAPCTVVSLAIRDDQIAAMVARLADLDLAGKVVLIHSGAKPLSELEPLSARGATIAKFHPLQSFSEVRAEPIPRGTPFAIEGEIETLVTSWLTRWGCTLHRLRGDQWLAYHIAAVLAANFLPLFVRGGASLLEPMSADRQDTLDWLGPLVRQSIEHALDGKQAQPFSGPAIRGDHQTIRAHLAYLKRERPELVELYRLPSDLIEDLGRDNK